MSDKIIKINVTEYPDFIRICKLSQSKLKQFLVSEVKKYGYKPIAGDGFVFAKGQNCEVLLTAHMDTVHKDKVKTYTEVIQDGLHTISSPQGIGGDDRCGIYMILQILRTTEIRPYLLFCEDEEIGGVGSTKFISTDYIYDLMNCKFFIELDRANADELVFYDDDNRDFHKFCGDITGYIEAYGSFSDISILSPALGISSVNISCGYYNAHKTSEEVVIEDMLYSIEAVKELLIESEKVEQFEYVEQKKYWYGNYSKYWDDKNWYKDLGYTQGKDVYGYEDQDDYMSIEFIFVESGIEKRFDSVGYSEGECFKDFFESNPTVCYNDIVDYYYIH